MINIGGDPNDSSYRYKMPRLITKIEGRGNGIKTVIVNMVDVAKALRCDPAYTTKFFGIELGAQSKFDRQKERAVVNGAFEALEMQKILSKFLTQYILCPKCDLPELRMIVKADVSADCQACGWTGVLIGTPKLSAYILKQKRVSRKGGSSKKERQEKREREKRGKKERSRREKPSAAAAPGGGGGGEGGDKPARKKKEGDEVVWSTPSSKQAQQDRREEEFKSMGSIHVIQGVGGGREADPKTEKRANQSPESILKEMFEVGATPKDLISEVRRLELAREWVPIKKLQTVFDALFDYNEPKEMVKKIEAQKEFLASFTQDAEGASIFIGVFEEVVGYKQTKLLPRVPILLQKFYDADVLDEDAILAWYESTADPWIIGPDIAVDIRKEALPFVQWLQTAEEDESEEEEDE